MSTTERLGKRPETTPELWKLLEDSSGNFSHDVLILILKLPTQGGLYSPFSVPALYA